MKFDKYTILARFIPAILSLPPFYLLNRYLLDPEIAKFFGDIYAIHWITAISAPVIFVFVLSQVDRIISKTIFEKSYFKDESAMPTTELLLYSDNTFSHEYKEKIRKKIFKDFNIILSSRQVELTDMQTARKKIVESVGLIRKRVKSGPLLQQYNLEYGFFRNMVGGSFLDLMTSLTELGIFHYVKINLIAFRLSLLLSILYLIPILLSKTIIVSTGKLYAKTLFQEYLES